MKIFHKTSYSGAKAIIKSKISKINEKTFVKYFFIAIWHLNNKIFISANFGAKKNGPKLFWAKIGWNESSNMQVVYGDKNIFHKYIS